MSDRTSGTPLLEKERFTELGPGRLGVVAARAGVGKSTCLVCLALDKLIDGKQVLHVSLDTPVSHVRASYEAALEALQACDPDRISSPLRFEIERRRVIHSYLGGSFTPSKLEEALGFLAEHMDLSPSMIIVDGFVFEAAAADDLEALARIAEDTNVELWMSALTRRDVDIEAETGLPSPLAPFASRFEVVLFLEPEGDNILVQLLKKGDRIERRRLEVTLDPKTRLLVCG